MQCKKCVATTTTRTIDMVVAAVSSQETLDWDHGTSAGTSTERKFRVVDTKSIPVCERCTRLRNLKFIGVAMVMLVCVIVSQIALDSSSPPVAQIVGALLLIVGAWWPAALGFMFGWPIGMNSAESLAQDAILEADKYEWGWRVGQHQIFSSRGWADGNISGQEESVGPLVLISILLTGALVLGLNYVGISDWLI